MMAPDTQGIVLLAHGSRDPLWCRPMEAVRARIQAGQPGLAVRCAYLELCEPDLASAIAAMAAQGVACVNIVPMFLGAGRHVREDLPRRVQELARAFAQVELRLQPLIGEDERMTALMADIASEAIATRNPGETMR